MSERVPARCGEPVGHAEVEIISARAEVERARRDGSRIAYLDAAEEARRCGIPHLALIFSAKAAGRV